MRLTTSRRLRRLAVSSLATCSLAVAASAPASAASPCAPGATAKTSTLCMINAQRAARGLRTLELDSRLSTAARGHSRDMVANGYFAHDSQSGARFSARIADTGWMNGRGAWSVGENLGWGSGTQATPASIVDAWMHSADHRRNILSSKFRVIGIGIAFSAPTGGAGTTYTTDFGS